MFPGTAFTQLTGIEYPIIQAPMGGGTTTPGLVTAVCNAGALGSFAGACLSPDAIRQGVAAVHARTSKPFTSTCSS